MKIGNGFVTNSSSTSFVISSRDALTEKKFLKAFGVVDESLLVDLYSNLYKVIQANIKPVPAGVSVRSFLEEEGIMIDEEEDIKEIEWRYHNGEIVYWGKLTDDGNIGGLAEAFFALESCVVIGDDLYFNARNSVY